MNEQIDSLESISTLAKSVQAKLKIREQIARLVNPPVNPPFFHIPSVDRYELPDMVIPTAEERNSYQSASEFMKAISDAAVEWKNSLPDGFAPAVIAILYGGIQLEVQSLAQVSFHGIRVNGLLDGNPCTMLAHQSTVQVLCIAQKIAEGEFRNPIGFVWPNNNVEV